MRDDKLALGAITLAGALVFAAPLIRGEIFTFRDHVVYFAPLRYFTADVLRSAELPLWNPYNASGEPWQANPQTAVFYPPAWLFLVLPFATAYVAYLMLHVILLGWTSYLLFRRNVSPGAAMVGAAAMMLSGPTLSLLDVGTILTTLSWVPLVLWLGAERARGSRRLPIAVDAAGLAVTFLAGEPFFAAFAAACYVAIVLVSRRDMRGVADVAIAGAGAAALAAVQILPFVEWLRGTNRGLAVIYGASAAADSMPLRNWLRLAVPPRLSAAGDPLLMPQFIPMMYAGVVVIAAAILGIAVSRRREAIGWALLLAVAILFSAGLAGAAPIRYPLRLIPIGMIGIAGFAAAGWDRIRPRRVWIDVLLVVVIAGDVVPRAAPLLHSLPFEQLRVPFGAIGRDAKILRLPLEGTTMDDPLAWLYGYQNLYERRFDTGSPSPAIPMKYLSMFQLALQGRRMDLVNVMAARYIFSDRRLPFPEIGRVRQVHVYDNAAALPMATLWTQVEPSVMAAKSLAIRTSSAAIEVDAPRPGMVVLTQRDAPGWQVWVDGVRRPKRLAHEIFRAVDVPAGRHTVVWRYRPVSLIAGAALSAAALLWLAVSLLKSRGQIRNQIVGVLESDRES